VRELLSQISPLGLVIGIVGLLVLLLIVAGAVIILGAPRARLDKRIAAVVGEKVVNKGDGKQLERDQKLASRKKQVSQKLKDVEMIREQRRGAKIRQVLIHAGLNITPTQFFLGALASGVVVPIIAFVLGMPPVGLVATIPIGLFGVPKLFLNFRVKRRLGRFTALFPDAIDIIVRGVRTGLTVGECLNIVAREMDDPHKTEFTLLNEGIKLGMTMEEVLQRLSDRVPTAEVRFFSIVLVTQQSTGGNLAETLAKLADVLRQRKKMKDKVQAMSSEAKASASIIGSLPFLLGLALFAIQPGFIDPLFSEKLGNVLIGIGLTWMGIGIFVMRKMINFDI
jgi:tight adherence protein B